MGIEYRHRHRCSHLTALLPTIRGSISGMRVSTVAGIMSAPRFYLQAMRTMPVGCAQNIFFLISTRTSFQIESCLREAAGKNNLRSEVLNPDFSSSELNLAFFLLRALTVSIRLSWRRRELSFRYL